MIQFRVFDKANNLLDELEPSIKSVSWRLNNVGVADFFMPYEDPKTTRANLAYGNRVLVEFDNGLPDFGGVIDPPLKQNTEGVTVRAYTAERMLDWRVTAKSRYFKAAAPGGIFQSLISQANGVRPMGIDIGSIYVGGTPRTLTYHFHDLLKRIKDLAKLSGQDFDVIPIYENGILTFEANWYDVKGVDKSDSVYLVEDINIEDPDLNEQGKIANAIFLLGAGQTWGDNRYVAEASDATSQADHGYREYSEVQSTVKFNDTLDKNVEELLAEKKDPVRRFKLSVTDLDPGEFGSYNIGDRVTLQVFISRGEWAHDTTVKVIAMEWNADNTMRVEVEEV